MNIEPELTQEQKYNLQLTQWKEKAKETAEQQRIRDIEAMKEIIRLQKLREQEVAEQSINPEPITTYTPETENTITEPTNQEQPDEEVKQYINDKQESSEINQRSITQGLI